LLLPFKTATNGPRQDAGGFCSQRLLKRRVAVRIKLSEEWNVVNASPESVGVIANDRPMIESEPKLGDRLEVEVLTVERAGGHNIATG
jgi:hypothetical protein